MAIRLRELRKKAGKSQEDIAKEMHLTQQNISHWERTGRIDPEYIPKLCKLLSCKSQDLLGI